MMNNVLSNENVQNMQKISAALRYIGGRLDSFEMNTRGRLPLWLLTSMSRAGIFGAHLSLKQSGLGLSTRELVALIERLAAIDIGLSTFLVGHYTSTLPIALHALPDISERLMPGLAGGSAFAALALTEPDAGSNLRAMTTSYAPTERGYRITGRKTWISNGESASVLTFFARGSAGRISAFAIDANVPGLVVEPEIPSLGLKAVPQNPIRLDNVDVDRNRLLGQEGKGFAVAEESLALGRLAAGAMALGGLKRCVQIMTRFAEQRQINTGRLLDNGVTRQRLADAIGSIATIDSLMEIILSDQAAGRATPREAYMILKVAGSELLWETVDGTLQLLGSRGYAERNGIAPLLRDARFLRIGEGPTETLLMQVGAAIVHREADLHAFVDRTDCAAYGRLADLAADIARGSATAPEMLYEMMGQAALWTLAASASEHNPRVDQATRDWIAERTAQSYRSSRRFPGNVNDAAITALVASYDATIGSLDDTWPFSRETRDHYLRRAKPASQNQGRSECLCTHVVREQ